MAVTGDKLTYTKNPSSPSSLKIFPMELSTPLWGQDRDKVTWSPSRRPLSSLTQSSRR